MTESQLNRVNEVNSRLRMMTDSLTRIFDAAESGLTCPVDRLYILSQLLRCNDWTLEIETLLRQAATAEGTPITIPNVR